MEGKDEEDEMREAAISLTPALQPDFSPREITFDQLSKFHELHKKRLQLKARSKMKKRTKDGPGKLQTKDFSKDYDNKVEASNVSTTFSHNDKNATFSKQDSTGTSLSLKKRQKLHWGSLLVGSTPRKGGRGKLTCKNVSFTGNGRTCSV